MKLRHRVVIVEWGDAFIDTNDFDEKDAAKTKPVGRRTCGFLIAKNQHGYVLATDEYDLKKDGVAGKLFVPHGMIREAKELT